MSITHASAAPPLSVFGVDLDAATVTPDGVAAAFLAGYSTPTRRAYSTDLRAWGQHLGSLAVEPLCARRVHVDAFIRQGEERGIAPTTLARRVSAIAGFYEYAVDAGAIDRSPVSRVRRPRVADHSPRLGLDREAVRALLAAAVESGDRDHALVCLLALNGFRVSETLASDIADLTTDRGHRTLTVRRKGGRRQTVPLAPRTSDAVERLIVGRKAGPLFITRSGRRLDRHAARKTVRRLARLAGIDRPVTPHDLRHSFVTLALDAGVSLRDVQDAAGHADPRTTRRYDRARDSLDRAATYRVAAFVSA
jgi:site-specific recombinase XerD